MMKPNIHPEYRTVVFHDTSVDEYFKIGSTIKTDREIELDGVTYPYVTIDVSSKSHPFYTGKLRTVASEGNVARFTQRFGRFVSTKKGAWWKSLTLCVPQKNAIQTVRKGRLYVICKSNPRFKAVQGRKKKRWFKIRRINDICLINNQTGLMLVYLLHQH